MKPMGHTVKKYARDVPIDEFSPDIHPEIGQQLELRQENKQVIVVTVSKVSESSVTLDANHPLAGENLTFDIQLVEII